MYTCDEYRLAWIRFVEERTHDCEQRTVGVVQHAQIAVMDRPATIKMYRLE
jgi:hypothetical protein